MGSASPNQVLPNVLGGTGGVPLGLVHPTHLVDAPKEGEEAAEQGCAHAGDVDEGTLGRQQGG